MAQGFPTMSAPTLSWCVSPQRIATTGRPHAIASTTDCDPPAGNSLAYRSRALRIRPGSLCCGRKRVRSSTPRSLNMATVRPGNPLPLTPMYQASGQARSTSHSASQQAGLNRASRWLLTVPISTASDGTPSVERSTAMQRSKASMSVPLRTSSWRPAYAGQSAASRRMLTSLSYNVAAIRRW